MKDLFPHYSIGHFINQPENPTEFEILQFERMEEPDVADIHKHTFYEIIWTENGKSRQTIDYKEYEVLPNSLFFISPNQVHQFEEWKPLVGGSILFTEDLFLSNNYRKDKLLEISFLDTFYANPCIQLKKQDFLEARNTIDLIAIEQNRLDKSKAIIQSLLHILIEQVQRCVDRRTTKPASKQYLIIYKQFKIILDTHFAENKNVGFYSSRLNITQHHLNTVSKIVTGKTAGEVIRARCILEAKRLLTYTHLTISEIASQLNYFDSSYFAKLFKSETGKTPIAFRRKSPINTE